MRRRRYLINGRLRIPFEGYQHPSAATEPRDAVEGPAALFQGLTPEQARLAQERLILAIQRRRQQGRPCKGPWLAAILAGIVSAVKHGRVGNSAWGWSMHGKRGGQVIARHALHHLREISPLGVRTSVIARDRRKAAAALERDQRAGNLGLIVFPITFACASVPPQRRTPESH